MFSNAVKLQGVVEAEGSPQLCDNGRTDIDGWR